MEFPYHGIEKSFRTAIGAPNYKEFDGWIDRNNYVCSSCGIEYTNPAKGKRDICGRCEKLFNGSMTCITLTDKEMEMYRRNLLAIAKAKESIAKANAFVRSKRNK